MSSASSNPVPGGPAAGGGPAGVPPMTGEDAAGLFEPSELAVVLSHWDTGAIRSIQWLKRGSRRSPKLVVEAEKGRFLLKRRAPGRDEPLRVARAHAIQLALADAGFPVARLVPTRRHHETAVRFDSRIYELFEHVEGTRFDFSGEQARSAGEVLARFHLALATAHLADLPGHSYHDNAAVASQLDSIPGRSDLSLADCCADLKTAYAEAGAAAAAAGVGSFPRHVVHGDYHPGNLLFDGPRVRALLDFDTARLEPRVMDIANGVLQFSLLRTADTPDHWPDGLDEARLRAFVSGYDSVPGAMISQPEVDALVPLMIEAMIAEATVPIAATGRFADVSGSSFLRMVLRKVRWLASESPRLARLLAAPDAG
ncbi:MAG: phosphotransferase [Phycisphaerales bacterium]|nr:phosphotransferase [Phycisphaerales bacterium]